MHAVCLKQTSVIPYRQQHAPYKRSLSKLVIFLGFMKVVLLSGELPEELLYSHSTLHYCVRTDGSLIKVKYVYQFRHM